MRGVSRAVSRARFRNDDGRKRRLRKAKKKIRGLFAGREPSQKARRRFERRACDDRARGGEAPRASTCARTFHGVGSSAARARGRGGGRDGGRAPRGEARDARLRGAGDAARAGGHHAFNELGFFRERACVSSRGARRRKERRAGTRTRHEAGPSRGDETRAWRRASKWPVEEQDAKYRRRLRSDRERKALFEVHFSHCSAPSNIETFLLKTGCAYVEY